MMVTPIVRVSALLALVGLGITAASAAILHRSVENLRADRTLVEQREDLAQQFERLLKDLQETDAERAALRRVRPTADNLVRFVEGIEAIAARVFIEQTIAAIPSQSDSSGQPYSLPVVRYRITLQGTAEKVELYLRELNRLPEIVRIEQLELRAPPDGHVFTNAAVDIILAVAIQQSP